VHSLEHITKINDCDEEILVRVAESQESFMSLAKDMNGYISASEM